MEENGNNSKGGLFLQYRPVLIALIAGICAIICVSIFTGNIIQYKKNAGGTGITATGSASVDFESDLVVWRGSFSVQGDNCLFYKSVAAAELLCVGICGGGVSLKKKTYDKRRGRYVQ